MPYFNIVAETNENTVVTEYTPAAVRSEGYQSEAQLEAEFIRLLQEQGYEYPKIHSEKELIENLRKQLEKLNNITFSDNEWDTFFNTIIANKNNGIIEKTRIIQEDYVQNLKRDDGSTKNIKLLDKQNILDNFDRKTYRNKAHSKYKFSKLTNIQDVASAKKNDAVENKAPVHLFGFNSIFAVSSVEAAKLYYTEFQKQMQADPAKKLRVATIFSYGANEEADGILDEENSEDTSALDETSREFLEKAISDYNEMFNTAYDTSSDKFQNYYKDVSLRMKNKEIDLLIVVNMFLTGFDATTLNTLWVDKNLKMHGLIQAFSRTNRILNSIKTFGNIVCFRALQKRVDSAIALFGDREAGGIVVMRKFEDYYNGFDDEDGKHVNGYTELIEELTTKFPLTEPRIEGEENQKAFIMLFGAVLKMRNLLVSFDDFEGKEILTEFDFQNYSGRYQDLRDEWKPKPGGEKTDILDDVVFEIELLKQIEINIDYILMLVQKYHDSNCEDKEVLASIRTAIDSSPQLRSKKALIETFISTVTDADDIVSDWRVFVEEEREKELKELIETERLKEEETRKFIQNAFRDGEIKTTGTDVDKLMPPISRFGSKDRSAKKQGIIDKFIKFFDKYFGISS